MRPVGLSDRSLGCGCAETMKPKWYEPSRVLRLAEDLVDVWRIWLPDVQPRNGILSADERARTHRYRRQSDRERFVATRTAVRCILGLYLGAPPHEIRFEYGKLGKPYLLAPKFQSIHFSISHAYDVSLCAVTTFGPVGIDIVRQGDVQDPAPASLICSGRCPDSHMSVSPAEAALRFTRCWAGREACVKAAGKGIDDIAKICGYPCADSASLTLEAEGFHVEHFVPTDGYSAALCLASSVQAPSVAHTMFYTFDADRWGGHEQRNAQSARLLLPEV